MSADRFQAVRRCIKAAVAGCLVYEDVGLASAELTQAEEREAKWRELLAKIPSTFLELGRPDASLFIKAFHDLEDDVVLFENSGVAVTAGDVRTLQTVLAAIRKE